MTTPSQFSAKGLSILASIPLVMGDENIGNFSDCVTNYLHRINASEGYASADFTMTGNSDFVENWLQGGLGRHIQVFGPALQTIWEGYVNEITATMGAAQFSRGPLSSIANRVMVMYTEILRRCLDPSDPLYDADCAELGEPLTGGPHETLLAEDTVSQYKYGIWEKVLTIGDAYDEDATFIRDLYLEEYAQPAGNPQLTLEENADELSVRITCRGYIDWLNNYVYNDETENLKVYCSELIKTILAADPNGVISASYDEITENLLLHDSQFLENKMAKTIIDSILAMGDAYNNRWTFGIYKDRKAVYAPMPTEVEYMYYKVGRVQQVETVTNTVIEPWDVMPCKWVGIPTFLTAFPYKFDDIRTDPRVFFGEEVTFTAPDKVNITGAKIRRLPHYLAQLGLSGV